MNKNKMLFEKDFYEMLLNNPDLKLILNNKIYYLEIKEKSNFPFAVINPILTGATREVNFFKPLIQLDIYGVNPFKPSEIAEDVIAIINHINNKFGDFSFTNFSCIRRSPLRLEADLWKVPIDIRFNCKLN